MIMSITTARLCLGINVIKADIMTSVLKAAKNLSLFYCDFEQEPRTSCTPSVTNRWGWRMRWYLMITSPPRRFGMSGRVAGNARLHFKGINLLGGPWMAKEHDKNQWLQVDLGSLAVITQIATQGGHHRFNKWVKTYTLSFSFDGNDFHTYKNGKVLN